MVEDIFADLREQPASVPPAMAAPPEEEEEDIFADLREPVPAPRQQGGGYRRPSGDGGGRVNPESVYGYLLDSGVSPVHAVGMLNNIRHESGFEADINERAPLVKGSRGGYGLFQHTGSRRKQLEEYARRTGRPVSDWQTQVDFALQEGDTRKYLAKNLHSPEQASAVFTTEWERPANKEQKARQRLSTLGEYSALLELPYEPGAPIPDFGGQRQEPSGEEMEAAFGRLFADFEPAQVAQAAPEQVGDFAGGMEQSWRSLKQMGSGAVAVAGDVFGIDDWKEWGVKNFQELEQEGDAASEGLVTQIEDIEGIGSAVDWLQYQLGQAAGSVLETVGSAAIGGLVGAGAGAGLGALPGAAAGAVGKKAVKGMLRSKVAELTKQNVAKGMAATAAKKAAVRQMSAKVGAITAVMASSYGQGVGDIYGEFINEDGTVDENAVASALVGAVPYMALDNILELSLVKNVAKGTKGEKLLKRLAKGIAKGFAIEGSTEAGQEAVKMGVAGETINEYIAGLGGGESYSGEEITSALMNSFLAGGVAGGAMAAPTAGMRTPEQRAADEEAEAGLAVNERWSQELSTEPETAEDEAAAVRAVQDGRKQAGMVLRPESIQAAEAAGLTIIETENGALVTRPENAEAATEAEEAGERYRILGYAEDKADALKDPAAVMVRPVDSSGASPGAQVVSRQNLEAAQAAAKVQAGEGGTVETIPIAEEYQRRIEAQEAEQVEAQNAAAAAAEVAEQGARTAEVEKARRAAEQSPAGARQRQIEEEFQGGEPYQEGVEVDMTTPEGREAAIRAIEAGKFVEPPPRMPEREIPATTRARELAAENGIDIADISAGGTQVTVPDVRKHIQAQRKAKVTPISEARRKAEAEEIAESKAAAVASKKAQEVTPEPSTVAEAEALARTFSPKEQAAFETEEAAAIAEKRSIPEDVVQREAEDEVRKTPAKHRTFEGQEDLDWALRYIDKRREWDAVTNKKARRKLRPFTAGPHVEALQNTISRIQGLRDGVKRSLIGKRPEVQSLAEAGTQLAGRAAKLDPHVRPNGSTKHGPDMLQRLEGDIRAWKEKIDALEIKREAVEADVSLKPVSKKGEKTAAQKKEEAPAWMALFADREQLGITPKQIMSARQRGLTPEEMLLEARGAFVVGTGSHEALESAAALVETEGMEIEGESQAAKTAGKEEAKAAEKAAKRGRSAAATPESQAKIRAEQEAAKKASEEMGEEQAKASLEAAAKAAGAVSARKVEIKKRQRRKITPPQKPLPKKAVANDTGLPPLKDMPSVLRIGRDDATLETLKRGLGGDALKGDAKQQKYPPNTAVVSPANSFGWMDGGIDAEYRQMFGAQIETRVQEEIQRRYGEKGMPIGEAFVLRAYPLEQKIPAGKPEWLIVAPTMLRPGRELAQGAARPQAMPDVAGKAVQAALEAAIDNGIKHVAVPGMGMGTAAGVKQNTFADAFGNAYDAADEAKFGEAVRKKIEKESKERKIPSRADKIRRDQAQYVMDQLVLAGNPQREGILEAREEAMGRAEVLADDPMTGFPTVVEEMLDALHPNDPYRHVIDAIHAKGLGDVEFAILPDAEVRQRMDESDAVAGFISGTNPDGTPARVIVLADSIATSPRGLKSLVHEMVHASMNEALRTDNQVAMEMEALRQEAERRLGTYDPVKRPHLYGLTDVHEFLAEALSNEHFQRALAGIRTSDGRSLWQKLIDSIRDFLGMPVEADTILAQVLSAAPDLMMSGAQANRRMADRNAAPYITSPIDAGEVVASIMWSERKYADRANDIARKHIDKGFRVGKGYFRELAKNRGWLGGMTTDQILRTYGEEFWADVLDENKKPTGKKRNSAHEYNRWNQRRTAIARQGQMEAEKIDARWRAAEEKDGERIGATMLDSTLAGIDPSIAKVKGDDQATYDKLRAQFNQLSPQGKQVYRDVRDYYSKQREAKKLAMIGKLVDFKVVSPATRANLQAALNGATTAAQVNQAFKAVYAAEPDLEGKLDDVHRAARRVTELASVKGPYFPLSRFGDYVVSGRKGEGDNAQEYTAFHESLEEAEADYARIKGQGYEMDAGEPTLKQSWRHAGMEHAPSLIAQLTNRVDEDVAQQINVALIEMLSENSMRKSELQRKGTPGVKAGEMRRAFAQRAFSGSWELGDLQTAFERSDAIKAMRKEAKTGDAANVSKGRVLDEIVKRESRMLSERNIGKLDQFLSKFGFIMYLASPSYAMVNATQPWAVGLPYLASKYGLAASTAMMGRHMSTLMGPAIKQIRKGYSRGQAFKPLEGTWEEMQKKLGPNAQKMIQELQDRGIIDPTFAQELYRTAASKDSTFNKATDAVLEFFRKLPQVVEVQNRILMAVSAYDLHKGTHEEKTQAAADAVYQTQFDYSDANKPRWFKWNIPGSRALFMFKMYAQGIYALTLPAFLKAMKGDKEAMKLFGGIMATHTLTAGVLGGIFTEPLRVLAFMVPGVDEEEIELATENFFNDLLGDKLGEMATRGLPRGLGLDVHGRVGMQGLVFMDLNSDAKNSEEWYNKSVLSLLGPIHAAGANAFKAWDYYKQGDITKAISTSAPKFIKDITKTYDQQTRGLTSRTGEVFVDPEEFNWAEGFMQGVVGFTSAEAARGWERRIARTAANARGRSEADALRQRFVNASPAERAHLLRGEIREFNRENPSYFLKPDNLWKSVRSRAEREREQVGGYYIDQSKRAWLNQEVRF